MSYGPSVRVRAAFGPIAPFTDLVVEVKDPSKPKGWREIGRVNDEDPTALHQADVVARAARRSLFEGELV